MPYPVILAAVDSKQGDPRAWPISSQKMGAEKSIHQLPPASNHGPGGSEREELYREWGDSWGKEPGQR